MRVLIIGLGSIAKKHIKALRSLKIKFNIFALRSSPDSSEFEDVINVYDLGDTVYDFAIISNPTYLHYKYIKSLTYKSIPLFIEKPPVDSLENFNELSTLISKKDIKTYVACNLRFHSCLIFLKEKIENKKIKLSEINEINIYCGSYLPNWRPNVDFKKIYSANKSMGGGVHLDLFHEIDYALWLFGKPKSYNSLRRSVSTLSIDSIDYANYILQYENFTTSIILNYFRKKPKRQIEIVSKDEIWVVDLINNTIVVDNNNLLFEDKNFNMLETYKSQMKYFINCLEKRINPMNSFEDSLSSLEICLHNE